MIYKTKSEIIEWLDTNYIINDDGTVYLNSMNLATIPVQFNIVTGSFYCHYNSLISLEAVLKLFMVFLIVIVIMPLNH